MRRERRKEAQSAKTWLSIPNPASFFFSTREHDWQGWGDLYSCLYSVYLSTQSPQGQDRETRCLTMSNPDVVTFSLPWPLCGANKKSAFLYRLFPTY